MTEAPKSWGREQWEQFLYRRRREWVLLRRQGPGQVQFWFIALLVGIGAGYLALGFRIAVSYLQTFFYGADDVMLASAASELDWYFVLGLPVLGGLAVGLILWKFTPDGRARSVAHVIEGAAIGEGRVEKKIARASAVASMITLSTGGSTGREGPVVHLGAALATTVSNFIRADGITARELMGCAVAAAVAASFNAPIAGALFALEVILRHFAVHAFAPIAIASVAGAVVGRLHMGDVTEFTVVPQTVGFYVELPAFMILGLVSGLVAVLMMKSIFLAEEWGDHFQAVLKIPQWARPACAGFLLGLIALKFPHIIGVGYETTSLALTGSLVFATAFLFAVVKVLAVAITVGGRMGGGVFSPALMLGALTGLAFGQLATSVFPDASGAETVYALAGMAAVASAVLGAPISTTLIVFELTGDWQVGIAVLVAVSLATILSSRLVDRSFFLTQLERRGVHLSEGPAGYLLSTIRVGRLMRAAGSEGVASSKKAEKLIKKGLALDVNMTLEAALPVLEESGRKYLPVVQKVGEDTRYVGAIYLVDALKSYNSALVETSKEEHA